MDNENSLIEEVYDNNEEWWNNFPLQNIPKDVWNHMIKEEFLNEKDVYTLCFVCKDLWETLSKLDNVAWKDWCIKFFEIEDKDEILLETFHETVNNICYGSYKTFYLGWNDLSNQFAIILDNRYEKRRKCQTLLKFRYMMKRVFASRQNRSHPNFLDFFLQIETECHNEEKKAYPIQIFILDLQQSYLDKDGQKITMKFTPPPNTDNKYGFSGLEGNSSRYFLKVISRNGKGSTVQKVLDHHDIYYNVDKRFTLLSKKDHEKLGIFFKNDKNAYLGGGAGTRSVGGRVSHSYAKGVNYTSDMQSRMLREDSNVGNLPDLACKKILECTLTINVSGLYDNLIKNE